jgi:hypothetical protein
LEAQVETNRRKLAGALTLTVVTGAFLAAGGLGGQEIQACKEKEIVRADETYRQAVTKTADIVGDASVERAAAAHGLQVLNLTWEDTGRYQNSSVGPNISDMTIQIQQKDPATGQYQLTCMPVIRFPNFADKSADIAADKFFLLVGNEKNEPLRRVSLREYLGNLRTHLSKPTSWKGDRTYLLADRDTHLLVSAQACFLPVPRQGRAEFNPVLFNYQSVPGDPAVLAILATRDGTSATVIDNQRDRFQSNGIWGQRLFFNNNGERASLTGQRLSDFENGPDSQLGSQPSAEAAGQEGLNMVLLIQVPLRQKEPMRFSPAPPTGCLSKAAAPCCAPMSRPASNVEAAVIGHGKVEGPFTEIDGLEIERDPRFPVRVTVQFYKATSNGVVSRKDMNEIAQQIKKVYSKGDYVGSLVTEGNSGRPTVYDGENVQPPNWWDSFWERYRANTGQSRQQVIEKMRQLRGQAWFPLTEPALVIEAERYGIMDAQQYRRASAAATQKARLNYPVPWLQNLWR